MMKKVAAYGFIGVILVSISGVSGIEGTFNLSSFSPSQELWSTSNFFGVKGNVTLHNFPSSSGSIIVEDLGFRVAPGSTVAYAVASLKSLIIILEGTSLAAEGTWKIELDESSRVGIQDLGIIAIPVVIILGIIIAILRLRD